MAARTRFVWLNFELPSGPVKSRAMTSHGQTAIVE